LIKISAAGAGMDSLESVNKPCFFVVGAPKCGTTALCNYLNQHPAIFIPDIKEPNFFGKDLSGIKAARDMNEYLSLFRDADTRISGEGSTWSLYSRTAAREIYEFNPHARIIIMLRNPADVLYSLHNQMLYDGNNEDIEDFGEALRAEADRRKGRRIPKTCKRREALLYSEVVRFADQVERYLSVFGRHGVHIIIYDDFKADSLASYREVLRFLRVDDSFVPEIKVINPSKHVRSRMLRKFYKDPPVWTSAIARVLFPQGLRKGIRAGLQNLNTQSVQRPPMDYEIRRKLNAMFSGEVAKLSDILVRDLTEWSKS